MAESSTGGETRLEVPSDSEASCSSSSTPSPDIDKKHCWVCFLTEDEEAEPSESEWVKPCRCKGTAKWVHQACLQRWIDEKQKTNSSAKVACAQCKTEYILVFPPSSALVCVVELYDKFLYSTSPFAAAVAVFGSVYCSACVYGAVTVMQVLGQDEGKVAIETAEPLMLLVGLPSIPVALILGKLFRWEDAVLKFWKRHHSRIPLLGYLIGEPPEIPRESAEKILIGRDTFSDPIAATRLFCGALLLPSLAMLFGRFIYPKVDSHLKRTIFGGITFILCKGFMRIYLRQQQYVRHTKRTVSDYSDATDPDHKEKQDLLTRLSHGDLPEVNLNE